MVRSSNRRTWIVRVTSTLSFGELSKGLEYLGDVEHIQLRDGSVLPTTNTLPGYHQNGRKKREYSPEGKASMREHNQRQAKMRHDNVITHLTRLLQENPHAPSFKLCRLLDETDAKPSRNGTIKWSEPVLNKYIDEALEKLTRPDPAK